MIVVNGSSIQEKNVQEAEVVESYVYGLSCPYRSSATIKQRISTLPVPPLIVMAPEHLFMLHYAHGLIINVQPSFPTIAVFIQVRVEHVDRIVPAACGLRVAVVVKHPTKLVVHWLRRFPDNGRHDFCADSATTVLSLGWQGERKKKIVPSDNSSSGAH
jgi:hypothetical protein